MVILLVLFPKHSLSLKFIQIALLCQKEAVLSANSLLFSMIFFKEIQETGGSFFCFDPLLFKIIYSQWDPVSPIFLGFLIHFGTHFLPFCCFSWKHRICIAHQIVCACFCVFVYCNPNCRTAYEFVHTLHTLN